MDKKYEILRFVIRYEICNLRHKKSAIFNQNLQQNRYNMPNIARCKPIFSCKRLSQANELVALCSTIRIYNSKNTRFYRMLAASVEIKRAPAWPPFDHPIVYIVAPCGRISSVWNILIGFVVWETRAIPSKSCSEKTGRAFGFLVLENSFSGSLWFR